jgi:hypothetical protein
MELTDSCRANRSSDSEEMMKPEGLLLCSQELATMPNPELDECIVHFHILYFHDSFLYNSSNLNFPSYPFPSCFPV